MTELLVNFVLGNGASDGFAKIDRKGVKLVGGKGRTDVDAERDYHTVSLFFGGAAGGTLSYEITQDDATLVKGKVTISYGQVEGLVSGRFKLKSTG